MTPRKIGFLKLYFELHLFRYFLVLVRLNEVMNNIISASRNVGSDFESHVQGGSQMVASTSADRNPQVMRKFIACIPISYGYVLKSCAG